VDVVGWVLGNVPTPPPTLTSRYLNDLTTNTATNVTKMHTHGCDDAGAAFDLLDVGAQSYHGPRLSKSNPGVAIALSRGPVRLTYPELVSAVDAYLAGIKDCRAVGSTTTVAVGTNNSGNFTDTSDPSNPPYLAGDRGKNWALRVIEQIDVVPGITVVAADDIENGNPDADGFDNSVTRAQQWEAAYLAAHPANPDGKSPDLIYNGSANGCPNTFNAGTGSTPCADGWTLQQFVSLTSNGFRIGVLPQIYYAYMAIQWANIDRVSGKVLNFRGSLSEKTLPGSLVPPQSWASLRNAIGTVVDEPPVIPYAIDIEPAAAAGAVLEQTRAGA
jgi:hypothetical protein